MSVSSPSPHTFSPTPDLQQSRAVELRGVVTRLVLDVGIWRGLQQTFRTVKARYDMSLVILVPGWWVTWVYVSLPPTRHPAPHSHTAMQPGREKMKLQRESVGFGRFPMCSLLAIRTTRRFPNSTNLIDTCTCHPSIQHPPAASVNLPSKHPPPTTASASHQPTLPFQSPFLQSSET